MGVSASRAAGQLDDNGKDRHLMEDAIMTYGARGFARVPHVLEEADVAMLRREWSRLWAEVGESHPNVQRRNHVDEGSKADRIDPAFPLSADLHGLCQDQRLTRLAEAALGRPARLFKDKLITKSSGTHGYAIHQDWPYWSRFGAPPDHLITMQIAIDACDAENGAIEVWPKAPGVLASPADEPLDVDPEVLGGRSGELMHLDAGDILLLHPLVPHQSGINRSDRPRRSYFVTYVSDDYADAAMRRAEEIRLSGMFAY
jgi:ectoine hydroxylase-related dioxygenase (phytanoyl-CoA dioxygenase family)